MNDLVPSGYLILLPPSTENEEYFLNVLFTDVFITFGK